MIRYIRDSFVCIIWITAHIGVNEMTYHVCYDTEEILWCLLYATQHVLVIEWMGWPIKHDAIISYMSHNFIKLTFFHTISAWSLSYDSIIKPPKIQLVQCLCVSRKEEPETKGGSEKQETNTICAVTHKHTHDIITDPSCTYIPLRVQPHSFTERLPTSRRFLPCRSDSMRASVDIHCSSTHVQTDTECANLLHLLPDTLRILFPHFSFVRFLLQHNTNPSPPQSTAPSQDLTAMSHVTYQSVMSHMNTSCHTWLCCPSHMNETRHAWMNPSKTRESVTARLGISRTNADFQ